MSSNQIFIQKRLRVISVFVIALSLILIGRMYDIGILKHDHYTALAVSQQRFDQTQIAQRGQIFAHDSATDDTSYYPLAFDMKNYAVWAVPNQIPQKEATANTLSGLLGLTKDDIFSQINNNKLYIPALKKGLTYDDAQKVEKSSLTGVYVTPQYSRDYPEGSLASQVLGFVNSDGDGQYGFEGHYNNELTGKSGDIKGEKDTLGRVIDLLQQKDPENGTSYVLTINRSVQYYVEKALAEALTTYQADSGTIIIMDVKTGGIVAMASNPTYDPNNYQQQAATNSSLFNNPAIAGLFEPGSIFKTIVMASALDAGVVTPDTASTFASSVNVSGFDIHTAEGKAFGLENMSQILQNSDNVGMVWVANKMGNQTMYDYLSKFGFFDKTGIDLDSEQAGYAPALKNWRDINRATTAFGQGISITPMEMVAAYSAIANKGVYVTPHIVDKVLPENGPAISIPKEEAQRVVSEQTANEVKDMLYNVVTSGTAKKAAVPGFKVGAKTGTAQIADPANGGYLKDIYIHSALGMAPIDDPRFVMLVKLDKPKTSTYAESTAVPVFGKIASYLLNYYYRISPTEPIN